MTTQVQVFLGGAQHDHHGIPADDGANAAFHFQVARVSRLVAGRDGVDVVAVCLGSHVHTACAGFLGQLFKDELSALRTEEQLDNFRQEVDGKGIPSYPHPKLMPEFWQFPTVSMGLGPIAAIYQARFLKYLTDRGIKDCSEQTS